MNACVREQRYLGLGFVLDLILDLEHVVVVDGDRAVEDEAAAVVPHQRDRRFGRQPRAAFNGPERVAGAGCGLSQDGLELGEGVFDRRIEQLHGEVVLRASCTRPWREPTPSMP